MNKKQFIERLRSASHMAHALAASYVIEPLPQELLFNIDPMDDPRGSRGPEGTVKFLGGRFVLLKDLYRLEASKAASLLWVDGRVPAWVNLCVVDCDEHTTSIEVAYTQVLMEADESKLPRDIGASPENALAPFRIRGPGVPDGWRSIANDGRVPLRRRLGHH